MIHKYMTSVIHCKKEFVEVHIIVIVVGSTSVTSHYCEKK